MGIMMVDDRMYAVMTQSIRSTPLSSPTMVGMAALRTVWLSEARSMVSMSPMNSSTRPRLDSCDRALGAGGVVLAVLVIGCVLLPLGGWKARPRGRDHRQRRSRRA